MVDVLRRYSVEDTVRGSGGGVGQCRDAALVEDGEEAWWRVEAGPALRLAPFFVEEVCVAPGVRFWDRAAVCDVAEALAPAWMWPRRCRGACWAIGQAEAVARTKDSAVAGSGAGRGRERARWRWLRGRSQERGASGVSHWMMRGHRVVAPHRGRRGRVVLGVGNWSRGSGSPGRRGSRAGGFTRAPGGSEGSPG